MRPTNRAKGTVAGESKADAPAGVEFECPWCGAELDRYHDQCPHCGQALDEEFCATYHPSGSPLAKIIALIVLGGGALTLLVLLLGYLLSL